MKRSSSFAFLGILLFIHEASSLDFKFSFYGKEQLWSSVQSEAVDNFVPSSTVQVFTKVIPNNDAFTKKHYSYYADISTSSSSAFNLAILSSLNISSIFQVISTKRISSQPDMFSTLYATEYNCVPPSSITSPILRLILASQVASFMHLLEAKNLHFSLEHSFMCIILVDDHYQAHMLPLTPLHALDYGMRFHIEPSGDFSVYPINAAESVLSLFFPSFENFHRIWRMSDEYLTLSDLLSSPRTTAFPTENSPEEREFTLSYCGLTHLIYKEYIHLTRSRNVDSILSNNSFSSPHLPLTSSYFANEEASYRLNSPFPCTLTSFFYPLSDLRFILDSKNIVHRAMNLIRILPYHKDNKPLECIQRMMNNILPKDREEGSIILEQPTSQCVSLAPSPLRLNFQHSTKINFKETPEHAKPNRLLKKIIDDVTGPPATIGKRGAIIAPTVLNQIYFHNVKHQNEKRDDNIPRLRPFDHIDDSSEEIPATKNNHPSEDTDESKSFEIIRVIDGKEKRHIAPFFPYLYSEEKESSKGESEDTLFPKRISDNKPITRQVLVFPDSDDAEVPPKQPVSKSDLESIDEVPLVKETSKKRPTQSCEKNLSFGSPCKDDYIPLKTPALNGRQISFGANVNDNPEEIKHNLTEPNSISKVFFSLFSPIPSKEFYNNTSNNAIPEDELSLSHVAPENNIVRELFPSKGGRTNNSNAIVNNNQTLHIAGNCEDDECKMRIPDFDGCQKKMVTDQNDVHDIMSDATTMIPDRKRSDWEEGTINTPNKMTKFRFVSPSSRFVSPSDNYSPFKTKDNRYIGNTDSSPECGIPSQIDEQNSSIHEYTPVKQTTSLNSNSKAFPFPQESPIYDNLLTPSEGRGRTFQHDSTKRKGSYLTEKSRENSISFPNSRTNQFDSWGYDTPRGNNTPCKSGNRDSERSDETPKKPNSSKKNVEHLLKAPLKSQKMPSSPMQISPFPSNQHPVNSINSFCSNTSQEQDTSSNNRKAPTNMKHYFKLFKNPNDSLTSTPGKQKINDLNTKVAASNTQQNSLPRKKTVKEHYVGLPYTRTPTREELPSTVSEVKYLQDSIEKSMEEQDSMLRSFSHLCLIFDSVFAKLQTTSLLSSPLMKTCDQIIQKKNDPSVFKGIPYEDLESDIISSNSSIDVEDLTIPVTLQEDFAALFANVIINEETRKEVLEYSIKKRMQMQEESERKNRRNEHRFSKLVSLPFVTHELDLTHPLGMMTVMWAFLRQEYHRLIDEKGTMFAYFDEEDSLWLSQEPAIHSSIQNLAFDMYRLYQKRDKYYPPSPSLYNFALHTIHSGMKSINDAYNENYVTPFSTGNGKRIGNLFTDHFMNTSWGSKVAGAVSLGPNWERKYIAPLQIIAEKLDYMRKESFEFTADNRKIVRRVLTNGRFEIKKRGRIASRMGLFNNNRGGNDSPNLRVERDALSLSLARHVSAAASPSQGEQLQSHNDGAGYLARARTLFKGRTGGHSLSEEREKDDSDDNPALEEGRDDRRLRLFFKKEQSLLLQVLLASSIPATNLYSSLQTLLYLSPYVKPLVYLLIGRGEEQGLKEVKNVSEFLPSVFKDMGEGLERLMGKNFLHSLNNARKEMQRMPFLLDSALRENKAVREIQQWILHFMNHPDSLAEKEVMEEEEKREGKREGDAREQSIFSLYFYGIHHWTSALRVESLAAGLDKAFKKLSQGEAKDTNNETFTLTYPYYQHVSKLQQIMQRINHLLYTR